MGFLVSIKMNIPDIRIFKQKALQWASDFPVCCCLDSNRYTDPYSQYDCLIAVGASDVLQARAGNAFSSLLSFYEKHKNWIFGLLSYELRNEIEHLNTRHHDKLGFPDLFFFVPTYLIALKGENIEVLLGDSSIVTTISNLALVTDTHHAKVNIKARLNKETYISIVRKLQEHITRGDIYEINFCQEFFAEHAFINPLAIYIALSFVIELDIFGILSLLSP